MKQLKFYWWIAAMIVLTHCSNPDDEMQNVTLQTDSHELSRNGLASAKGKPGSTFPSYNTSPLPPDATGMTSNAVQLAAKVNLGWNLGNTLEASGGETGWGNPLTTQALIDRVK